jgi:radical SAM superfamily enzyme YgiQ (UPF0313 family)
VPRSRELTVGLVQFNMGLTWEAPRLGPDGKTVSYGLLPYSVGLLEAYARRHATEPERLSFRRPLYARVPVEEAAQALAGVDVAGFSAYVWNENLSLAVARRLKELSPETLVVFGGPQVPDRAEAWLRANPFVDIACRGEGEATFTRILDGVEREEIPGISFLTGDGEFRTAAPAPRIADLSLIPSPYLEGAFAPLMEAYPDVHWVVMWETNRGCPFSCAFCDWGSATQSKVFRFELERLLAEIDWIAENEVEFVFCCDANFGMLPRDLDLARAVVETKRSRGYPAMLSVQNTKNALERAYEVQTLLASEMNSLGVTIALQSTSPVTLEAIRRQNISSEAFAELQRRFARDGVYTYTDLIVGLPGETYEAFASGISDVIENGQHNHIQFHDCSVLPNAEMGAPEYLERYGVETMPQLIPTSFVPQMAGADAWTEDVPEFLDLVVATATLSREDWVRAKMLAWASDLYYFDRVLQVPLAVVSHDSGLRMHQLVEGLLESDAETFPVLASIADTLRNKARRVQLGESSYVTDGPSGRPWLPDQHVLVELVLADRVGAFYREAEERLAALAGRHDTVLEDAVELNRALLCLPFRSRDAWLALSCNLWEHYVSLLAGEPVPLEEELRFYRVDRTTRSWQTLDAWYEHLLWCQKDKRVYLQAMRTSRSRARAAVAA